MHPYVVHIVVGFVIAGCVLRIISLTGEVELDEPGRIDGPDPRRDRQRGRLALGVDAHGPAERVPGAREAVIEHEEWGERARNLFLLIAAVEVVGLAVPSRRRWFNIASAALGAGGTVRDLRDRGTWRGTRLLVRGRRRAPHRVNRRMSATSCARGSTTRPMLDRRRTPGDAAARLFAEMKQRWPDDEEVQVLAADSTTARLERSVRGAGRCRRSSSARSKTPRIKRNGTLVRAYAFLGLGQKDSAPSGRGATRSGKPGQCALPGAGRLTQVNVAGRAVSLLRLFGERASIRVVAASHGGLGIVGHADLLSSALATAYAHVLMARRVLTAHVEGVCAACGRGSGNSIRSGDAHLPSPPSSSSLQSLRCRFA